MLLNALQCQKKKKITTNLDPADFYLQCLNQAIVHSGNEGGCSPSTAGQFHNVHKIRNEVGWVISVNSLIRVKMERISLPKVVRNIRPSLLSGPFPASA